MQHSTFSPSKAKKKLRDLDWNKDSVLCIFFQYNVPLWFFGDDEVGLAIVDEE